MGHRPLPRRTFLAAAGVSLTLPWLESMRPAIAATASPPPPNRLVFICTTLGLHPDALWPDAPGEDYAATDYLQPLQPHRDRFTLFSGLSHEGQNGRQPHNSELTFLTSARGPGLDGFRNTVSVDQVAAEHFAGAMRFPSITLGSNASQSQSYTRGGVMIPADTSPAALFARLFLTGDAASVRRQKRRLAEGRSILDGLAEQTESLRRRASAADHSHLDEYFQSVRDAETAIAEASGWIDRPKPEPPSPRPTDIGDPTDLIGRTRLLLSMIPLIMQTDSSRVVTVMIQDHQNVPRVPGVTVQHHNLSHHGRDPSKIAQLQAIERRLVERFGDLIGAMGRTTEAGGTLLDRTSIVFGSNLGNANAHDPHNLPIFLAGGPYEHGRYVAAARGHDSPLCNLFLRLLRDTGVETESFGQSTAALDW